MSDETEQIALVTGLYPKQRAFLAAFAICGKVTEAAQHAEIGRTVVYNWLQESEQFKKAFELHEQIAARNLEDEAYRRAHDGVRKLKFFKGEPIMVKNPDTGELEPYVEHEYSDSLAQFLLRGLKPDKYREKPEPPPPVVSVSPITVNVQQIILDALAEFPDAKPLVARKLLELERAQSQPKTNGHAADVVDLKPEVE